MLCLSGEDDNEHEVILLIQVAVVADLVQTRLLNPTAALCDEKSVKRSHHVLSNHTMSENTFLWKTVMIYIMSFK